MTALLPALGGLLSALAQMMNNVSALLLGNVNPLLAEVGITLDKVTAGLGDMNTNLVVILATTDTLIGYLNTLMVNLMIALT